MIQNWLTHSIGRKLLASFVSIFLVTYLLTAGFVFTSVRSSMTNAEAEALANIANQKVELISARLQGLGTNMHAWAQLEVMNDLISGDIDKRVARTLVNLKAQYALSGDIYAFDAQDKLLATSESRSISKNLPAIWINKSAEAVFIDKHPNPLGGGNIVAMSVNMSASFSHDFKIGTLVVTLPWSTIEKLLTDDKHQTLVFKDELPVLFFDSTNKVHVQSDEMYTLFKRSSEVTIASSEYVAGYSEAYHPPLKDWHVAVLKDASLAYQPIHMVAYKLAILGLILSIPFVLSVRWLSRKLTKPIESLTRVVSGITSSGDLSKRASIDTKDELGTLALAFNSMAENLQRSSQEREKFVAELETLNRTLEQRVNERTQALGSANKELTGAIDSLKAAQSQLVQSEKMVSLGQLVAGVAHELNNPIGFIYANFPHLEEYTNELLALIDELRQLPMNDEQKAVAEKKIKAIDLEFIKEDTLKIIRSGKSGASRIKEIVSSLRSFSRLDEAELKSVVLEDGINDTLAILNHHIRNRVEVIKDYQLNQPVLCRAGQINQVFMNILYNAIQAIDGTGSLHIATRREGEFAVVSVADSGKGISPEIISKIFDPFFTTKKVGEGTGLGLSISYGIVESHGGRIDVASEVGKGTKFMIYILMNPERN
ncbi:sensor protein ZraS [mine drainage metagenome]|uniref:histidine kinase n=1 Tax=mine drainage metagenome TaxID=410659 RepID=A0A1J5S226_9ZZZZ